MREGDNLFCASMVALKAKTGEYVWHFQQVHHDIWDYDAASPVVLFDTVIDGKPRKGIAEAGRTGWLYILDRTDGKPLIGIEERAGAPGAAAEDGQDAAVSRSATRPCPSAPIPCPATRRPAASSSPSGRRRSLMRPSGLGGTNWSPVPYSPDTGYFYVPGTVRTSAFARYGDTYKLGQRYVGRHAGGADRHRR